jgi:hypothetical protein
VVGDDVLELGEAPGVAVPVVDDALSLVQRAPHDLVARHRDVEDDLVVVEEAILPQHADARAFGMATLPSVAGSSPATILRKGRLARPVGADEAVAGARVELERRRPRRACGPRTTSRAGRRRS